MDLGPRWQRSSPSIFPTCQKPLSPLHPRFHTSTALRIATHCTVTKFQSADRKDLKNQSSEFQLEGLFILANESIRQVSIHTSGLNTENQSARSLSNTASELFRSNHPHRSGCLWRLRSSRSFCSTSQLPCTRRHKTASRLLHHQALELSDELHNEHSTKRYGRYTTDFGETRISNK
jgi:hypothetical protein